MAKTTRKTKAGRTTRTKSKSRASSGRSTSRKTAARKTKSTSAKSKSVKKKVSRKKVSAKAKTTAKKKSTARGMKQKKKTTARKPATRSTVATASSRPKTTGSKTKSAKTDAKATSKSAVSRKRPKSVAEAASAVKADDQGYVFINGRRVRMISTQGFVPAKKSRPQVVAEQPVEENEPELPLKTRLSKKELEHYRNLLLIKRAEIVGDLSAMEAAALRSSGGNLSHMPIHMADIGTDTYDQDFTLGLAEAERRQLREIDEALQRIDEKIYGVCLMTGKDIPKARLDAKPWAKYTIEAARLVESQTPR